MPTPNLFRRLMTATFRRTPTSTIRKRVGPLGHAIEQLEDRVVPANIDVAATEPTLGYNTLKEAFDAINAGTHTGSIVISVNGDTTETATASLNASGSGAASYSTIAISPAGGAARTISGAVAGQLVDLNGADNVTINGLNSGGNSLTIANTSTSGAALQFINDASNNLVEFVTLRGVNTSTTSGTLVFGTTTGTTGNDNNTISNCNITDGASTPNNAIFAVGTTTTTATNNSGNTISNCNVSNFFNASSVSTGILVGAGNTDWSLTSNRLFQTATRTYTTANTHRAIQINNTTSGNNFVVSGNTIGFATVAGTGTYTMAGTIATRFIGIDLAVGTTTATSVQGNTVTAISLATSSGASTTNGILCGINITGGNVNVGTVTGNTIGTTSGVNSLAAVSTTTGGLAVGINSSSTGTIVIQGNSLGGLSSSGTTAAIAGSVTGINVSGVAASMTITGNTIGNATADNMRGGTSSFTTGSSLVSGINLPSTPTTANISNNTIRNLASYGTGTTGFVRGIWTAATIGSAAGITISGNSITNLASNTTRTSVTNGQTGAVGINCGVGTNNVISGNTISNIALTNTGTNGSFAAGITSGNATNTTIASNTIFNITNAGTSTSATTPSIAAGVIIRSGTTAVTVTNNMISLGTGQTTNTAFLGIMANHGSAPDPVDKIYFNTVNIEGTAASGAQPSFGFARTDFSAIARTPTVDFRNNIITNTRSGGTGKHYAIANNYGATPSATGWGANASNFNVLNAAAATVGFWGGDQTFAGWQTASASDASSFSGITVTYVNAAIGDLHLNMGVVATDLESTGQAIAGITTDIDGQTRPGPAGSVNGGAFAPDLGADEFDGVPNDRTPPETTIDSGPPNPTNDNTPTFTFSGDDGAGSGVASFEVSLDGSPFVAQTSPFTTPTLAAGSHTFAVRARDAAGNVDPTPATDAWTVDTNPPTITSVTSVSANGFHGVGDMIDVTVNFSEAVTLTGGNLTVNLDTGGSVTISPFANATSASGTYTVAAGENSADLNSTSPVVLAGGATLQDAASNNATLTIPGGSSLADLKAIVVDTTAPTVTITDDQGGGTIVAGTPVIYTIQFSEGVAGVEQGDFSNAGTAPGTFSGFAMVDADTYNVTFTPTGPGTLQLQINNQGAVIADVVFNELVTPVTDDTTLSAAPASREFDFQPSATSPLQAGSIAVLPGTNYTAARGFGWTKTPWRTTDAGPLPSLAGNPLAFQLRDYMSDFGGLSSAGIFRVDFPTADPVQITTFLGDASGALDGIEVAFSTNGTTYTPFTPGGGLTIPAGKFTSVTSPAVIPGVVGETRSVWIRIQDLGGSTSNWSASGLAVRTVGSVGALNVTPSEGSVPADGLTVDTYTITGATPGAVLNITASLGTILTDARTELLGNQVIADGTGMATFQVRRPFVNGNSTITVSDFTGAAAATATQNYSLVTTRKFDMNAGTASLPDASWLDVRTTSLYSAAAGYGWLTAPTAADLGTYPAGSTAAQQALYRDYHSGTGTNTFKVYVGAFCIVNVKIYTYTPSLGISGMTVSLEGGAFQPVSGNSTTFTATAGADGILDITFKAAMFANWATNGIEVF